MRTGAKSVQGGAFVWLLLTAFPATTTCASAVTIGFDNFSGADSSPLAGYSELGFTVTPTAGDWEVSTVYGRPAPFIYFSPTRSDPPVGVIVLKNGVLPFRFVSVDLYTSLAPISYSFGGTLSRIFVFSTGGTFPSTVGDFGTALNPFGEAVIDRLEIRLSVDNSFPFASSMGIDNIVVTPADVPEPGSLQLVLMGLGVAAAGRNHIRRVISRCYGLQYVTVSQSPITSALRVDYCHSDVSGPAGYGWHSGYTEHSDGAAGGGIRLDQSGDLGRSCD